MQWLIETQSDEAFVGPADLRLAIRGFIDPERDWLAHRKDIAAGNGKPATIERDFDKQSRFRLAVVPFQANGLTNGKALMLADHQN